MKLVSTYLNKSDCKEISQKLNDVGIMTHITMGAGYGEYWGGVWVVIDSQYNDAIKYLEDNSHKINNPISRTQMKEIEKNMENYNPVTFDIFMEATAKYLTYAVVIVLVVILFKAILSA